MALDVVNTSASDYITDQMLVTTDVCKLQMYFKPILILFLIYKSMKTLKLVHAKSVIANSLN